MTTLGYVAGGVIWAFLSGLFAGIGGASPHVLDVLLGAWLGFLPWAMVHAAGRYLRHRREDAARVVPPEHATEAVMSAGRSLGLPIFVLAGIMGGVIAGPCPSEFRALAGGWAAGPMLFGAWALAILLGEFSARIGWRAKELRQLELFTAGAGLMFTMAGAPAQGGLLDVTGAWFRLFGPVGWVGPATEGRLLPESILIQICLLAVVHGIWCALGAPRVPLSEQPEESSSPPVPLVRGRPASPARFVVRTFFMRWGWVGPVALVLAILGVAWHSQDLARLGKAIPLLRFRLPLSMVVLLVQVFMAGMLVAAAPDWVPPAPPHARSVDPAAAREEGDRAFSVSMLRLSVAVVCLLLGLAVGGSLHLVGLMLVGVEAGVLGFPAMGLSVLALRWPGGAFKGGLVYVAGVLLLVLPHLALDVLLAILLLGERDGVKLLLLGWLVLKSLAICISSSYGAYLALVYCQEWRQENPWLTPTTSS